MNESNPEPGSNRQTAYDGPTSAEFSEVDDKLGWALGYPFVLRALGIGGSHAPEVLLDYGCGPGRVAERVAHSYGLRVVAVDPSAEMLAIAKQRHAHPLVTYHQVSENRPIFLADNSIDAAMTCFVFVVLPFREQLRAIVDEVWRVLRPGGRFAVLDPHPGQIGVQFSTLLSGESGVIYQEGDPRLTRLLLANGEWLKLNDYFWSVRTYQELLAEAGFIDLQIEAPLLADAYGLADPADLNAWDYEVERIRPPFLIVHGGKPRP